MALLIKKPSVIKAAGNKEKIIKEFFGNVNSNTTELSLAMMKSPEGWEEPGQCPEFEEYTLVLKGMLKVVTRKEEIVVYAGEAVMTKNNEWVRYSTPWKGGAEYISVCIPAFSPLIVHRDEEQH